MWPRVIHFFPRWEEEKEEEEEEGEGDEEEEVFLLVEIRFNQIAA